MGQYDPKLPSRLNSVNITLFVLVVALGYGGWFYLPHFWPVFQLTGIMKGACNSAYRDFDDRSIRAKLLKDVQRLSMKMESDDFEVERIPYSGEEMEAMKSEDERDLGRRRGKAMRIRFHKVVTAKWPLLDKWTQLTFDRVQETSLEIVEW